MVIAMHHKDKVSCYLTFYFTASLMHNLVVLALASTKLPLRLLRTKLHCTGVGATIAGSLETLPGEYQRAQPSDSPTVSKSDLFGSEEITPSINQSSN